MVDPDGSKKNSHARKKPLPATYEPDKRTAAWLKLKKDYVSGVGDSLDLVPIGAWYGNGRKVKWWSPILVAVYDQSSGRFVAVCKCMSGALYSFVIFFPCHTASCTRFHGQFLPGIYFSDTFRSTFFQRIIGRERQIFSWRRSRYTLFNSTVVGMRIWRSDISIDNKCRHLTPIY
jgi:hypothetical protein